jgi:hypothetical protein
MAHTNLPENFRLLSPGAAGIAWGNSLGWAGTGWYYEPVDYEGDVPFAGPFATADEARESATRWVDSGETLS